MQLSDWIGRQEVKNDFISPVLVRRMAATLGEPVPEQDLPPLWHWMFFQPELPARELGRDGHPALGQFMPPANGRNRMWAGGSFEFGQPLRIGEPARCVSTIENVVEKHGHTGSLIFVTVRHEYFQNDVFCFVERQNIVYREPSPPKISSDPAPEGQWSEPQHPNETQLFRYSAVTFNGHRIHYDFEYVTKVEGYDGLVVHGPMMATWALQSFIHAHPDKRVKTFEYRGMRPTTVPQPVVAEGRLLDAGNAEVWITNDKGLIQKGKITFE